jgi:hypothetical protein
MAWHEVTEPARQRALAADAELRRRHRGIDLPPLHPQEEHGPRTQARAARPDTGKAGSPVGDRDQARPDIEVPVTAARNARRIAAAGQVQSRLAIGTEADDLMRRRKAEALREAQDRRTALRQEPLASRYAVRQAQPELEPEAGG